MAPPFPPPFPDHDPKASPRPRRVLLLGGTGTIGRATALALVARGHAVACLVRPGSAKDDGLFTGTVVVEGDVTDPAAFARASAAGGPFDAVVSCLASRTGVPREAWAIDFQAHRDVLTAAREAGVEQMVLLSAICVQKPLLAFQKAKLAFEEALIASGLIWSIVRPTAFFKSLSGQIARVQAGRPYLIFGDGTLTACKPISDADLGAFIADCLDDPHRQNRILPIGGPGPAVTPRQQGEALFALTGRPPRFRRVPVALLDGIIATLGLAGRVVPALADKAEFARIGRYYATESMLVLDPATGRYDAEATPSTGTETLFDYYAKVLRGEARAERGDHAVFRSTDAGERP
jgi:divinyl chlorophyllide a 8-vinyl-reductase